MAALKLHPWEPEETVGTVWHNFVTRDATAAHEAAAVTLEDMRTRIGLMFRGLGGDRGTEIIDAPQETARHRRSLWRRIGHGTEAIDRAVFDGERLGLPPVIALFDDRSLNTALYLWIAAYAAHDTDRQENADDPLLDDIARLWRIRQTVDRVLAACPGLVAPYHRLCEAMLARRNDLARPPMEQAVELVIRSMLGASEPLDETAHAVLKAAAHPGIETTRFASPKVYKPYEPLLIWPERRLPQAPSADATRTEGGSGELKQAQNRRQRARRRKSDQANRRDSLILHRFETILSWTDFLNLNRRVEDDDEANARKAADDAQEMGITDIDQRPATRLAFDLDMAPADIDRARLMGEALYHEWDYRRGAYHDAHVRVLHGDAETADLAHRPELSEAARRRLRAVRRQFEALRPKRMRIPRQVDGDELDLDALIGSRVDLAVTGHGSDRVYIRSDNQARDLAVATLIDTSRSTESAVGERPVIEIARESLLALGHGLAATGDAHAIYAFSSLRRDKVFVNRVKAFSEAMGPGVEARIGAIRPGFYTRLGAAIRHTAAKLSHQSASRRLLLVLTDGKPNDLDHYEGRYGIEDSRKAVIEARRNGLAVFGIAIDRKAQQYIPHIFGRNGYAIVSRPEKLVEALPLIYRHLVT